MTSAAPYFEECLQVNSPGGVSASFHANGSLRHLGVGDTTINLFAGNAMEAAATALVLRRRDGHAVTDSVNLISPRSGAQWRLHGGEWQARGQWGTLHFQVRLRLCESAAAWCWHVDLHNDSEGAQTVDLLLQQDVALAPYADIRVNEHYVSQYLDHTALSHPHRGVMLATRQNLANPRQQHPWMLVGSLRRAVSYATDALQSVGLDYRGGADFKMTTADLPGQRLQHEHAMVSLQDAPCTLAPHASVSLGFFAGMQAHHAEATGPADLAQADVWAAWAQSPTPLSSADTAGQAGWREPVHSVFTQAPMLDTVDLSEAQLEQHFPPPWRNVERGSDGTLLSFFSATGVHVALRAKERQLLRPHGHLLRTGDHLVPDERGLTSTCWMGGVFHSMVTEGHVSANRLLSTVRTYLGLDKSGGQRVLMDVAGQWQLLGMPSAFAMSDRQCHWIYRHAGGELWVSASALADSHVMTLELHLVEGEARRFLISHRVAVQGDDGLAPGAPAWYVSDDGGVTVEPAPGSAAAQRYPGGRFHIRPDAQALDRLDRVGADELLYLDGRRRGQPFVCLQTRPCRTFGLRITSQMLQQSTAVGASLPGLNALHLPQMRLPQGGPEAEVAALSEWLPWLQNNALVHYLSPRGLEQFTGGGWGTRDVSQGPVELLLAHGCLPPVRDLLVRVFSAQQTDGDWPQWFMFYERDRLARASDSHGDVVYWPLVALGQYLLASGDSGLLDEVVPFFHAQGGDHAEQATLWRHVERALGVVARRHIPATHLAAYGHGDWNDSLQPADPRLRDHLCSAWTVTLHYQMLRTLGQALQDLGRPTEAEALLVEATAVWTDFQRHLMPGGVLAGYVLFEPEGDRRYLLHPQDAVTGAHYSLLPMIHGVINELLEPDQAEKHLKLIRDHLLGPDGARLFDRPLAYRGGPQRLFQRAETSSYFGREIGLMYTHAHLRYAEALAHHGDAETFFQALCLGSIPSA